MNPTTFLQFFNEFKHVSSDTIELFLSVSAIRVPVSVWGTRQPYAQALLTAHMLCLRGFGSEGAGGGAVSQETVGDLSRSYDPVGQPDSGDAEMRVTRYGIEFLALRNEIVVGMTAVNTRPRPFPRPPF